MSWSFEHKGQHAAVAAKVLAEPYLPAALKTAIVGIIGDGAGNFNGVAVKSAGHVEANGAGTVYELKVDQMKLALNADLPATASTGSSGAIVENPPAAG